MTDAKPQDYHGEHFRKTPKEFVLLDTNIWVYSTYLLSDPLGSALLYALKHTEARIALPSVVEMEILKHAVALGLSTTTELQKAIRKVESIGGFHGYFAPPTSAEIGKAVEKRLAEIGGLIERIEWTREHAASALRRIMEEEPPNGPQNQQFKDSLIWEAARQLAFAAPVNLLTADKGFYEQRDPSKGLAKPLMRDAENSRYPIRAYSEISHYLERLAKSDSGVTLRAAIGAIAARAMPLISGDTNRSRLSVGPLDCERSDVQSFPLEDSSVVAARFRLQYYCQRMHDDKKDPTEGLLHVFGACKVKLPKGEVSDLQVHHADFNSPSNGEGKVWLRISGERGQEGPLAVEQERYWILRTKPDDGCEYYYREWPLDRKT